MEQLTIVLIVIIGIIQLIGFWYIKVYLEDIHGHVYEEEKDSLLQSYIDGWNEDEEEKKDAK